MAKMYISKRFVTVAAQQVRAEAELIHLGRVTPLAQVQRLSLGTWKKACFFFYFLFMKCFKKKTNKSILAISLGFCRRDTAERGRKEQQLSRN